MVINGLLSSRTEVGVIPIPTQFDNVVTPDTFNDETHVDVPDTIKLESLFYYSSY